jgi:hypothetical protein
VWLNNVRRHYPHLVKQRIIKALHAIPGILILGLFVFIGLRGCVVTMWAPPKEAKTYAIRGGDDREMSLTFLPDRKALIVYGDPDAKAFEAVLWQIRSAEYARHYIGPLWNVSRGGESLFGIRWVSGDAEPVVFTYSVANKIHVGFGDSSFPPIGGEREATLHFRPKALKFSSMWLQESPTDSDLVEPLLKQLAPK